MTREEWLAALATKLTGLFTAAGAKIPSKIRYSCGWPSARGRGSKNRVIGECWQATASEDSTVEIFVSPTVGTGIEAAAVLVHELVHACGCRGHKGEFRKLATMVGLEGPMKATHAGKDLQSDLEAIIAQIGEYPHATLNPDNEGEETPKKQGTRMLKVECPACSYVVRTTQKWIDKGLPTCCCGEEMVLADGQEDGE